MLTFDLKANDSPLDPPVLAKVLYHYDSRVVCYLLYVPTEWARTDYHVPLLIRHLDLLENLRSGLRIVSSFPGEDQSEEDLSDCVFTRRVVLYIEGNVTQDEKLLLQNIAISKEISLIVRDATYATTMEKRQTPHAFISHDARDKDQIARPLATLLTQNLCKVWYDEFTLKVGDSLRESIESGLKSCHRCVLLLTPNFLSNNRWAKREFDSIFTREIVETSNLILPVWHQVTRDDVYQYSPILADRVGIDWNRGAESVARELIKVLL